MDEELVAVLARVERAFVPYPRRVVVGGCPHCRPSTRVDEHDLFSLTIRLGGTVGDRDDVPAWLCREVTRDRLLAAFERDQGEAWAGDLAGAYDVLGWHGGGT